MARAFEGQLSRRADDASFRCGVPDPRRGLCGDHACVGRDVDDDTATAPDQMRPRELRHEERNVEFAGYRRPPVIDALVASDTAPWVNPHGNASAQ
jgi:hypothetical protein